ncbi:MAG: hypothetical protein ABIQ30_10135 [Devosia sp.]
MNSFWDAEQFHSRYDDGATVTTGSFVGDVAFMAEWLVCAYDEVVNGQMGEYLSEDEPANEVRVAAATLELIYAELRPQGFLPPPIDHESDPMGFLESHAAFLAAVRFDVVEPKVTVH